MLREGYRLIKPPERGTGIVESIEGFLDTAKSILKLNLMTLLVIRLFVSELSLVKADRGKRIINDVLSKLRREINVCKVQGYQVELKVVETKGEKNNHFSIICQISLNGNVVETVERRNISGNHNKEDAGVVKEFANKIRQALKKLGIT